MSKRSKMVWPRIAFDYSGTHVLVTGGTSGIGAGIACAFLEAGADVTITGTRDSAGDYEDDLSSYQYRKLQLANASEIPEVAQSISKLDILVNNAGWNSLPFEEAIQVNLMAVYQLSEACRDLLAESSFPGGSSIINMASMMSYSASPYFPGYGAGKAAIVQLTKTLAAAYAERGIRVNAVAPGSIDTNMVAAFCGDPEIHKAVADRTPMKRWGKPQDIAGVVLCLTSPAAAFVTGQTLPVCGGYSIVG